jgi:acyl-CoA synthetase (AMP-forming)/AMP-acid ligase II
VVVLEVDRREGEEALADLDRQVRLRVAHALGLPLADLVLVRRGQVPKTTSGKVQRRELRRRYLAGELERLPAAG